MRCRIKDLLVPFGGEKQVLMLEIDEDFREYYDEMNGHELDVSVKLWKPTRSLDANAYAWVLIDRLAAKLGVPKTTVYRDAIREIGGVSETVCVKDSAFPELKRVWESNGIGWQVEAMPSKLKGCTNAILYAGSSTYDSKQMSRLLDFVKLACEEQGIPTIKEDEAAHLLKKWAERT